MNRICSARRAIRIASFSLIALVLALALLAVLDHSRASATRGRT